MKEEFWLKKWLDNEIGFNQAKPNKLMQRYFPTLNLKSGSRIFVPLCGKSIDMLWLAGQGYKVIGVELSQSACKAFFKENIMPVKVEEYGDFVVYNGGEITLLSGDFFSLNKNTLGKVDAVYDRAALIALPSELRQQYSQHMMELFDEDTKGFLITTTYDQDQMQGPPFSIDENEVNVLYGEYLDVKQVYSKPVSEIPMHLKEKGLLQATEQVYCLTNKESESLK